MRLRGRGLQGIAGAGACPLACLLVASSARHGILCAAPRLLPATLPLLALPHTVSLPLLLLNQAGKTLTEVEIDEHLTAYRAAQPGFVEPSFPTIAGQCFNRAGGGGAAALPPPALPALPAAAASPC